MNQIKIEHNEVFKIRIVLIGFAGSGKSTTGNILLNKENVFKIGSGIFPETNTFDSEYLKILEENKNKDFILIDTPGFSDPAKNVYIINDMFNILKEFNHITFILCMDNQRYVDYKKDLISLLNLKFPGFLKNTALVFTKWFSNDLNRMTRIRKEYQTLFEKEYNQPNIACFFIDTDVRNQELKKLKNYLIENNTFYNIRQLIQEL